MKYIIVSNEKITKHNFTGKLLEFVRKNVKGLQDGKYEVQQVKTENGELCAKYRKIR
ncbi:hypothetical protein [Sebaldella sp. S0638]|uniref:hypothetical protein n=1 Tax=Sebaldella sp. S0638 TaxID=2957809 RepID=UPI00209FB0A0|nr:hypothetical protein [Sebaldella sp. S0638]MCP1226286.1 hypothetical protein [Sebaldella sp. S0638]